jgi:hypothetical protein
MQRNRKEEHEKKMDRLYKYYCDLDTHLEWVPVEEPQFIGWDLTITLSEQRLRSRDAEKLNMVLHLLGCDKPTFIRHPNVISLIRGNNHNYANSYREHVRVQSRRGRYSHTIHIPNLMDRSITVEKYESLTPEMQKYFGKSWRDTWWSGRNYYYVLDSRTFPYYELRAKIEKSWSTHRGIPRSDDQSQYDKIRRKFDYDCYWNKRWGSGNRNYKGASMRMRKSWSRGLNVLATTLDDKENYELIEQQECKLAKRVRAPWD